MQFKDLATLAGFCDNIEKMIRSKFHEKTSYYEQKILLDLMTSVMNVSFYYEKQKGLKNGTETI